VKAVNEGGSEIKTTTHEHNTHRQARVSKENKAMKSLRRIAALFLVAGAALVSSMTMNPADADAAGATINCAIPLNVVCQVSHPDGIKSVKVMVDFGDLGTIAVVDKTYPACPKNVQVSWDPIVPNYQFQVETCSGLKLTNGNDPTRAGGINDSGIKALVVLNAEPQPLGLAPRR
jgi:hypothetical protein